MKTIVRNHFFLKCILNLCLITFFVSAASATVPAANDGQESDKKAVHIKQKEEVFVYQTEGRADPFMPFISERAATTEDPNEIIDEDIALTGMQLFEPGQLTLVALLSSGANKYAMVQDFTGRGYVIVEGTKIGRRGVVSSIIDNKVIIEETSKTRGGKVLKNQIAMVLKKEEGEE